MKSQVLVTMIFSIVLYLFGGELLPRSHSSTDNPFIGTSNLHIILPQLRDDGYKYELVSLGVKGNSNPSLWAYEQIGKAFSEDEQLFYRYFQFWNIAYSAYNKAARGKRTLPEPIYWLTNACGQPIPKPVNWPQRKSGEGYESISDGKSSVGMDRTDDIKKGIYQVLKIAVTEKPKNSNITVKTALLSNIHALRHSNHIARRVGLDVEKRINALKIGQKMQDLPEELWHDSFKFYVKYDLTRQGGPNLRMIRLDPSKPSLTVTGYIFNKFVHPYENRFITVREAARLQGLPNELRFEGTLTSTQLQVGNAVPVPLVKAVFENLVQQAYLLGFKSYPLKALSLFSGAGGMDIGSHLTGCIETKVAIDNWSDACATLHGYFADRVCILEKDISTIKDPLGLWKNTSGEIDQPDIIFGGPPCQTFSQAGKQKGLQDERGTMIYEFLRFVKQLQPPFFVMENVSNLKGISGGKLYQDILEKMMHLGYNVCSELLLAADFGTPQLRRRLFFLGCRKDIGSIKLPLPTHSLKYELCGLLPYLTVGQVFADLPKAEFSR